MRIELPSAAWTETLLRVEEDAHTLTVAGLAPIDPLAVAWTGEPAPALRVEVPAGEPVTTTLTL